MNFSKINYRSFLGRMLRLPLHLIPKGMVLPILQGRLRGKRWIVGAGEHGYWLGSYEYNKRLAFEREVTPDSIVYDIGANVGYFSLLAAVLVGKGGQVFAFEPLPRNVAFLRKHVALNRLENVTVIEAAVSGHSGEAAFQFGASDSMGHLGEKGDINVQLISLDDWLTEGKLASPDFIKIDVEGAEYEVVCGAQKLLKKYRPILFLDTHQREAHHATINLLQTLGYQFERLDGKDLEETKEILAKPT
ncbi:MAG: FkbM family methyltransferase [Anaerolineales bacterium]